MRATTAKPLLFIFLHLFSNGLNKEGNVITSVLSPTDPFKTPLGSYSTNPIHVVGIKQLSKSVRTLIGQCFEPFCRCEPLSTMRIDECLITLNRYGTKLSSSNSSIKQLSKFVRIPRATLSHSVTVNY